MLDLDKQADFRLALTRAVDLGMSGWVTSTRHRPTGEQLCKLFASHWRVWHEYALATAYSQGKKHTHMAKRTRSDL